ncbi:hypothetical protein A946_07410 [Methylacidiphilum kamchatkense Kam1]|uniref:Uncharacterized protein n=2 Tax=Methylacidiphilum kamchatkense TaxID=431057 RepID=A0A0C1RTM4_9BACT|nr:hypothetical protein [Methylacidiphilum kamchatkense]KIE58316.1 hypothetical protein A946_07410 [Methylacidiphilum kamchatkense Kam1]QDQ42282.1 hypothetical protein kam1_1052 [Methylacidiphilum kamchatkense Kam1]
MVAYYHKMAKPLLAFYYWFTVFFFLVPDLEAVENKSVEYLKAPFEFDPKIWHYLFDDKPVILLQKHKSKNGSLYYILEKIETPDQTHIGTTYYIQSVHGKVYLLYEDRNSESPIPPLTNMGIPWEIAVEIEKINLMHKINSIGLKNTSKWVVESITKHRNIYFYTPEFIEAAKRLKILPKNYKLPPLLPKDEAELEKYLSTKITPTLIDEQLVGESAPTNSLNR